MSICCRQRQSLTWHLHRMAFSTLCSFFVHFADRYMLAFSSDDTRRLRRVERNILRDQFCDADVTEYRRETQTCIRSRHQAHHGRDIISTVPACLTGRFISRTINRLEMARRSKSRRRRRLSATTRRPRPRRRVGRPVLSSQLHAV